MNNIVGNIMLSQDEEDKHSMAACEAAITNAEAALRKLPKTKGAEAKAKALHAIVEANEKQHETIVKRRRAAADARETDPSMSSKEK